MQQDFPESSYCCLEKIQSRVSNINHFLESPPNGSGDPNNDC